MFKYVFAILAFVAVAMAAPQYFAPSAISYSSGFVRPAVYSSGLYPSAYSTYNTFPSYATYSSGYPYAYSYL